MRSKIAIVDGNNLLYRAYYKFSNMRSSKGLLTSIIYGFPYVLKGMLTQHDPDDMIIVFDGGRDEKRIELLPDYKKRDKKLNFDRDDFYRQRGVLIEMLKLLGIKYVMARKEADDVIWLLARKLKRKHHVLIVSSDKDFNQLVSEHVSIWNPKANKRYNHKNIDKELGFPVNRFVDYLILDGDQSDNIKGLVGVGQARAKHFIANTKSISDYLTNKQEEIKSFERSKLEPVFLLNRQLIDIRLFCRRYLKNLKIEINVPANKIKKKKLAYLCSSHSITTFIKPDFIKAFDKLLTKNKKIKTWPKSSSWVLLE